MKLFISILFLFFSDQVTKRIVDANLPLLTRYPILGQDWINYSRVHNLGLMGDRYSTIPKGYIEPYTHYLPLVCLLALIAIMSIRFKTANTLERLFSGLFVAGGVSNLWDHWRQDFVVDTFQIYIGAEKYLPFNLADIAITAGTVFLLATLAQELRKPTLPHFSH